MNLSSFLNGPSIWSVAICYNSIVLTSGRLVVMFFEIMTGAIFGVASFARWVFAPESEIASVYFIRELGGVPILLIELILSLLIIYPNLHSQLLFLPLDLFLQ